MSEEKSTEKRLEELMVETAASPKQVQGGAGMVTQHSPKDIIALDKYLASKKAMRGKGAKGLGIKFFALRPGRCE